jgi:hypothetical protein
VITKNESDNADRVDELTKQHKKALSEAEEKAKKLEGAKEKVERSKEEAIQNLNEKIRLVISMFDVVIMVAKKLTIYNKIKQHFMHKIVTH